MGSSFIRVRPWANRPREARPAAARLELRRRRKQRFARHDVHVDAGLVVVEQFAGPRRLGAALLGHAILFRREAGDGLGVLRYADIAISFSRVLFSGSSKWRDRLCHTIPDAADLKEQDSTATSRQSCTATRVTFRDYEAPKRQYRVRDQESQTPLAYAEKCPLSRGARALQGRAPRYRARKPGRIVERQNDRRIGKANRLRRPPCQSHGSTRFFLPTNGACMKIVCTEPGQTMNWAPSAM